MKIFVYKTLFVSACVFILFQLLIGVKIKQLNYEVEKFKSKENIEAVKNKLREEMQSAIDKEEYLDPKDAKLIRDFLNKIKGEISN
tara:strand:- start:830 stop:1087 length:258 start_codon:yes stop_codon:yes gene_type:complete